VSIVTIDSTIALLADRYGAQACAKYVRDGSVEPRLILLEAPVNSYSRTAEVMSTYEMSRQLMESALRTTMANVALRSLIQALLDRDGAMHGAFVARSGFHPNYAVQINLCWLGLRAGGPTYDVVADVADDPDADPAILVTVHAVGRSEPNCHIIQSAFQTAHFQRYRDQHFRNSRTLGRFEIEI
jgi:hypothetical protein